MLLQVNIDGEASKSGCAPEEVMALADQAAALPQLQADYVACWTGLKKTFDPGRR